MSPSTRTLLEAFAAQANWSMAGNPADTERFNDFVIAAYRAGEHAIPLDEFLAVLNASGKGAGSLAQKKKELPAKMFMHGKYEDGIRLLCRFEQK